MAQRRVLRHDFLRLRSGHQVLLNPFDYAARRGRHRPRYLLMDEPSMGLSPLLADQVLDTGLAIQRLGVAVLLVEQNAVAVLRIAQRGYVMRAGRIVVDGQADQLSRADMVIDAYKEVCLVLTIREARVTLPTVIGS